MNIQKALVVDDSKVAHLTLRKLLTERGIQVDWVGSGEDAIAYMEKQHPDVIFMDVMMPGMDGFEATHAITNNSAITAPPVIMCSANTTDEDKLNAKRCGAVGFLAKPYTPDQMDQILTMVSGMPVPAISKPAAPPAEAVVSPPAQPFTPPVTQQPAEPATAPIPAKAAAPSADVERIASAVAKEVAERTAREAARAMAEQAARQLAEETGRKAAQAAVQAAVEAAKKAAVEVAKTTAAEAARSASEQVSREISQDIAQKIATRSLAESRETVAKGLEAQIPRSVHDALGQALAGKEFKQQLQQIAAETILPKAEASAQRVASDSVQKAVTPGAVEAAMKRANLALAAGLVGVVIGVAALVLSYL